MRPESLRIAILSPLLLVSLIACSSAALAQSGQQDLSDLLGQARHVIMPQTTSIAIDRTRGDQGIRIDQVRAKVKIVEQTASTTLQIELSNPSPRIAEAVLLLPVPEHAAISSFMFEGASGEPSARLLRADEARRLYDAIVARTRDPALLEFAGYNLIRSSVFPVPAHGTQKIRLTYEHILDGDGNRIDYTLPRSESLQNRIPWNLTVDVKANAPISMIYSPSHALQERRLGPNHITMTLQSGASPGAAMEPGAFRLSYLLQREEVSASLLAYPDPTVGGGYFLLMAGLPAVPEDITPQPREVTIVIDRSGSMAGGKLDQVVQAALQVIEGLNDGEAFNIIDYATTVSAFSTKPVLRTRDSLLQARKYLASIRPSGGTNIHDALVEALRQQSTEGMLPIVLFLTDGLPTVGKTSERQIRDMVTAANTNRRRLFTFGVGEDVNVPLLDRLADQTRATSTYVLPTEDVELKVAGVFKRLQGPVLASPHLQATDGAGTLNLVRQQIPAAMPDLFEGDQLIVLGQYWKDGPITFELDGDYFGKQRTFRFDFDLTAATTRNSFVPRLWATRRIGELIDLIRQAGAPAMSGLPPANFDPFTDPRTRELAEEVLRLSTEFGILTEYTAFLATEGTDLSDWVELELICRDQLDHNAIRSRSGRRAVTQSLNNRAQKSQTWLNRGNVYFDDNLRSVQTTAVQQLCDRAFYQRGNQWIDSRLVTQQKLSQPQTIVTFGSAEYKAILIRLINEHRQAMLSLPGEIMLQLDGKSVLIRNTVEP